MPTKTEIGHCSLQEQESLFRNQFWEGGQRSNEKAYTHNISKYIMGKMTY